MLFGAEGSDVAAENAGKGHVAVLVSCYNEEAAPGKVMADCLTPAEERRRS